MLKKLILSFGFVSVAAFPLAGRADVVLFDPDGPGPDPAIQIDAFDFFQGNILSKDGVTAIRNFVTNVTPISLSAYSHARLSALLLNGQPYPLSSTFRLNAGYEIGYVIGFPEKVTGVIDINSNGQPDYASFELDKTPGPEATFFELWWGSPLDSSDLAGTGFNNGTRILRGQVVQSFSNFLTDEASISTPVVFDQFSTDNYPTIKSHRGAGSGHPLTIQVLEWNQDFFPALKKNEVLSFNLTAGNVSNNAPFTTVDPSGQFTTSAGGEGIASTVIPSLGAVNGSTTNTGGPDFQFQTDINATPSVIPVSDQTCRMTGGGVTITGDIILDASGSPVPTASAGSGNDRYTFGGQIGAPTASQPQPFGEWTHHQFQGPDGDFVFHAGTHSAPDATKILKVGCVDPGFCQPARPAPFKQLNWEGIGQFNNVKYGTNKLFNKVVVPGVSLHYVKVHYEDLGEPGGPNGAQTKNASCSTSLHTIGSIVGDPTVDPGKTICANCPDVYQISIYAKSTNPATDPSNKPIYQVGGYIDHGNIQLHPAIK